MLTRGAISKYAILQTPESDCSNLCLIFTT
jgi:hypothetical protein